MILPSSRRIIVKLSPTPQFDGLVFIRVQYAHPPRLDQLTALQSDGIAIKFFTTSNKLPLFVRCTKYFNQVAVAVDYAWLVVTLLFADCTWAWSDQAELMCDERESDKK